MSAATTGGLGPDDARVDAEGRVRELALKIDGLNKTYRGVSVLEDVSLRLDHGEFLGLIGPNGAGKSVLLRTILGLEKPDEGSISVYGKPPSQAHSDVAYVPQYARFDRDFPISVRDAVLTGRLRSGRPGRRQDSEDHDRAEEALKRLDLLKFAERQIGRLSGGQLQRVLIARALATDARLFLFDEPTANLDASHVTGLYEFLGELASDHTVVLVSHDIGVMTAFVDSVACLNRRMHYHGDKQITHEMIEETYGCPVDFVVHEHRHVVLPPHDSEEPS
jgi:zinc transport system ATP-binding protein